ncbi:hypothetical protein CERSUDRAFT_80096 [Gelatoporia subvermispora B]|uniref:Uncharacterized protein n=1 Tax=Ceriporiopsis subvermispora (strain B) TaxID=914234 RepID=M2RNL6_CERS8|nr:hypothetical protein CERSUDRAFT_80096 [Gelatoporia subvermispora B]
MYACHDPEKPWFMSNASTAPPQVEEFWRRIVIELTQRMPCECHGQLVELPRHLLQ